MFYFEIPSPENEALGRWLGHEGETFMNGFSGIIKEAPDPLSSHHVRTQWKGTSSEPGFGPTSECSQAGALILDFRASKTIRNKFLFFISYPICDVFL